MPVQGGIQPRPLGGAAPRCSRWRTSGKPACAIELVPATHAPPRTSCVQRQVSTVRLRPGFRVRRACVVLAVLRWVVLGSARGSTSWWRTARRASAQTRKTCQVGQVVKIRARQLCTTMRAIARQRVLLTTHTQHARALTVVDAAAEQHSQRAQISSSRRSRHRSSGPVLA